MYQRSIYLFQINNKFLLFQVFHINKKKFQVLRFCDIHKGRVELQLILKHKLLLKFKIYKLLNTKIFILWLMITWCPVFHNLLKGDQTNIFLDWEQGLTSIAFKRQSPLVLQKIIFFFINDIIGLIYYWPNLCIINIQ